MEKPLPFRLSAFLWLYYNRPFLPAQTGTSLQLSKTLRHIKKHSKKRLKPTVSVHKEVFSYERLVATSVMEAAAFSLSMVDHGLDDSAIASISFMVARFTSPTPVK